MAVQTAKRAGSLPECFAEVTLTNVMQNEITAVSRLWRGARDYQHRPAGPHARPAGGGGLG